MIANFFVSSTKDVEDGSLIFNNLIWIFTIQTYSHSNASVYNKRKSLMNVFFPAQLTSAKWMRFETMVLYLL